MAGHMADFKLPMNVAEQADMDELGLGKRLRSVVLNGVSFMMFGRLGRAGTLFGLSRRRFVGLNFAIFFSDCSFEP